jgi:hypothetical protein
VCAVPVLFYQPVPTVFPTPSPIGVSFLGILQVLVLLVLYPLLPLPAYSTNIPAYIWLLYHTVINAIKTFTVIISPLNNFIKLHLTGMSWRHDPTPCFLNSLSNSSEATVIRQCTTLQMQRHKNLTAKQEGILIGFWFVYESTYTYN